ncbi:MFS transporter [Sphingomonas ginsengisoli (ex An et al. 2013)]|uniref:MFS transporter n=1 Tax=Sphingomonas ginsengisoli (ex An et al. 2013) TaxID=363835 RepID=UPI000DEF6655|nr:MFS transporter [Sphingomonas ginsengisoli An et al. 2013]
MLLSAGEDSGMDERRGRQAGVWLTLLLGALVLLNYVDRGALGIAAPKLKHELDLTPYAFGLAVSAFAWIYAPAQFAVGWLADRFCVYRLIAAGLALWALATLLTGFVSGLAMLVALRVILGVGEGVAFPAASKIIARHVAPEHRGIANGTVAAALAWGPALGTFAGGLLLASVGWRAIFWVFGGVTLLWLVPWLIASRPHWSDRASRAGDSVPVRTVMREPTPWLLGIGHFCNTYGFFFLLAWLPLYLVEARGLSIGTMTGMATAVYLVQGAGALLWGWGSDALVRRGWPEGRLRKGLLSFYQLSLAAAIVGAALATSTATLFGWLLLAGAVGGIGGANSYALAQIYAGPRAAGSWVGILNGVGNCSGIVGPILTGWLVGRHGGDFHVAFYASAGIVGFGALWWWLALPPVEPVAAAVEPGIPSAAAVE